VVAILYQERLLTRGLLFRIRLFPICHARTYIITLPVGCTNRIVVGRFYCTADPYHTPLTTHHSPFTLLYTAFARYRLYNFSTNLFLLSVYIWRRDWRRTLWLAIRVAVDRGSYCRLLSVLITTILTMTHLPHVYKYFFFTSPDLAFTSQQFLCVRLYHTTT
jgi:hypothetical protein